MAVLVYLIAFSKIDVDHEVDHIENVIAEHYQKFDNAYELASDQIPFFKPILGVDFLVYNQKGKLVCWTDNLLIPPLEQFLLSPTAPLLSCEQGEYLYKTYDQISDRESFKIIAFIPIRRIFDSSLRSFPDEYNRTIIPNNMEIGYGLQSIPIQFGGKELINVQWSGQSNYAPEANYLILFTIVLLFGGLFLVIYYLTIEIQLKKGFGYGAAFMMCAFLILRGALVLAEFPSAYFKLGVFAGSTFRFEWFYSSLGDAVLNVLALNIFMVYMLSQKAGFGDWISRRWINAIAFLSMLLGYFVFYLFADTIQIVLAHSQITLDITESLRFPLDRVVAYMLVSLFATLYFLITYFGFEVFRQADGNRHHFLRIHLVCLLLSGVVLSSYDHLWLVLSGNLIYQIVVFQFRLPANLKKLRFDSLNYLILSAILLALTGSFLIYKSFEKKETNKIKKFATYLQLDRDIDGEYLLSSIMKQIKNDVVINSKMINPQSQHASIVQRIRRTYFNTYFNNYEIEIALFDDKGQAISTKHKGQNITDLKRKYQTKGYATSYRGIYYDGQMDLRKRKKFVCFVELERYQNVTGYLEIELRLKKFSGKRVLPQVLVDRTQRSTTDYDYAIFQSEALIYKSGDFDYESLVSKDVLASPVLYTEGMEVNGYFHWGAKSDVKTVLISSPVYPKSNIISNFSFLFALFLGVASLAFAVNYLLQPDRTIQLNFSTKILLYSGASFIIPLILVGLAVMTSTDASNKKEIDKSNLKKALVMTEDVNDHLSSFYSRTTNREQLENGISELANHSGMDLNVYSVEGRLLASSTPMIFESNIVSDYLVADAMDQLVRRRKESLILDESIGNFRYKTSYVSILSPESGELLGVLAAPYFASKDHLTRQQLQVFGNIINIFTFVFILSILIAYFIISKLTKPIVAIADRLHQTGFVQVNEPIEWETDDEIGTLVNEYNNMLSKLESTKVELARNEKEAAWREMAQQVAHEIKNPLTPMKLTIQHLQRIMEEKKGNKKSLDILLSQIDTLDEIVTSFSHFAKMPTPESEPFDIRQVLEKSIDLHVDKMIKKELEKGAFDVMGDKKLFGRIFNNLILNAFQAMKAHKDPVLKVSLRKTDDHQVKIQFQDHGEGIPLNIQDKVFMPNFSTKETGSGIGLAVAKRGIEHAGGDIWFETKEGLGTTFLIKMPLYPPA
ncbi:HAMP domain-containing histidine kinase [Reichenbachiella carrageenanivorans]|uniref:histidine kinase n=1 Tax=Reichenbachiella carrageenanivorans TaxID=2979869 RepID=A0ABY6D4D8_9BACT|nr:HAMP domain-containing sensor histidine kinase [Reichenbachiella carrageenanivorans]UXX79918.1 HAMP domain-containing histidine kinase [Reichenbachiella carrageenanivorans]